MKKLLIYIMILLSLAGVFMVALNFDYLVYLMKGDTPIHLAHIQSKPKAIKLDDEQAVRSDNDVDVSDVKMDNSEPEEFSYDNILKIKSKTAIGWLLIPQKGVEISLPINSGIGGNNMLYGAGEQYSRDIVQPGGKGNYVLASHYTPYPNLLFTNLNRVKIGTQIYVADDNNLYVYDVTDTLVEDIESTSYEVGQQQNSEKSEITVYTCTDVRATKRYIVKGVLSNTLSLKQLDKSMRSALSQWLEML